MKRLTFLVFLLPAAARLWGARPETQHVLGGPNSVPVRPKTKTFASLGDSYSAGIGTFVPDKEDDCRRGEGAYPFLLAEDLLRPGTNSSPPDFQWLSCTGSTTTDLLSSPTTNKSQIDLLNTSSPLRFATLSIGGNDLGFFDVMNACVFRFYSFYSGTCAAALASSEAAISSPEFDIRLSLVLHEILDKIRWEVRPDFFVVVTGYARFFDAETKECDAVSLGVWWGGGVGGTGPKLTREVRRAMNSLVVRVNRKIKGAVEGVNKRFLGERQKVLFVDFDEEFEGHRFCERDVQEPDYERGDTWFFLPGGGDNGRNGTVGKGNETTTTPLMLLEEGSPLTEPERCLRRAEERGDWGERALCYMATARHRDPSLRLRDGMLGLESMWYVPTYYGKTFHPRSLGHEAIRDKIYQVWRENGIDIGPR
ncbi:lipase 1 [Echria macrotheca]|uniref:Lipase 1 n=1 Tax=Echria macrotheca TaxID=438768 RepID=A0AAJ0BFD9_9PEZI|nr:lipase 1 [Echria macrotheca]